MVIYVKKKIHCTNKLALFPSWEHLFVGEVDFLRSKTEKNLFVYLSKHFVNAGTQQITENFVRMKS